MTDDLLIGDTSQIARYIANSSSLARASSRNVPDFVFEKEWRRVYLLFAEQRTAHAHDKHYRDDFYNINVNLTLDLLNRLRYCRAIVVSTTELWNKRCGPICMEDDFDFEENYYTDSKYKLTQNAMKKEDVITVFPFNFNSIHRHGPFLFTKIFHAICHKEQIQTNNLDFNREILHARFVSNQIISCDSSKIIGSGSTTNMRRYVTDIFSRMKLDVDDYVIENPDVPRVQSTVFYKKCPKIEYSYEQLLEDTVNEL